MADDMLSPEHRAEVMAELGQGFRLFLSQHVARCGLPTPEMAAQLEAAFAAGCTHGITIVKRHASRLAAKVEVAPSDPDT